jgi:hypothetical protein
MSQGGEMTPEQTKLVEAIDRLEDVLAAYFAKRDLPMEIQAAVGRLEEAMIEAGLSPLAVSGLPQRIAP